jgi:hypothetical protein
MTEATIPTTLKRVSWTPNYMLAGVNQTLPAGKMYGITATNADGTLAQHFAAGATHIQDLADGRWGGTTPFAQRWANYRATGHSTPASFANSVQLSKSHGYGGQLEEDGFSAEQSIEGFGRIYDRLVADDPTITSPAQTNIFGDYFQNMTSSNLIAVKNEPTRLNRHRNNLGSQASCRLRWSFGDHDFNISTVYFNSPWGYPKQNGILPEGYMNTWAEARMGGHSYQVIYDIIKCRGAASDRKLFAFAWAAYDASGYSVPRQKSGLKYTNPNGILYRTLQWEPIPWEMVKQRQFWYLLLADGAAWWEVSLRYTNDVTKWEAGIPNDNVEWQPEGGSRSAWNGTPTKLTNPDPMLIDYPLGISENGVAAGTYLFMALHNAGRQGEFTEWCPFSYTVDNGATQSGYAGGNTPLNGGNGNARVSAFNNPNYGEANVVDSFAADKPIVLRTKGPNGFGYVALNPHADPDQTTVITLTDAGNQTLTLKGDTLSVFY